MSPDEENVIAVWVVFKISFYGYDHDEMVNIFEYSEANCDYESAYYWSVMSLDRKDEVIEQCYRHWVSEFVAAQSVQNWILKLEQVSDPSATQVQTILHRERPIKEVV